jgi:uncharacterized protein (TIGR02996 family)
MIEDEAFLRTILAQPDDMVARLAYADWLEDRADPRAEYLLLEAKLAGLAGDDSGIQTRMDELRAGLPPWWLAIVGGLHATTTEPDPKRIELVAQKLGRPVSYADHEGYERTITAAAVSGLHDSVAYVECRSQQRGAFLDINFYLRIRGSDGREMMQEVETYNPYFGCDVQFFDWFGDEALVIYREKRDTYICRFGVDSPVPAPSTGNGPRKAGGLGPRSAASEGATQTRADTAKLAGGEILRLNQSPTPLRNAIHRGTSQFMAIQHYWVLHGLQLGCWGYRETTVRRLTIPGFEELPPLSESEAAKLGLLPGKHW